MIRKIIITFMVLLIIFVVGILSYDFLDYTINTNTANFKIDEGMTLRDIAKKLEADGIIKSSNFFVLYAKYNSINNDLKAGEFTIQPDTSTKDLIKILQNPIQEYIKVTIPEGFNVYQIATILSEHGLVNKEVFLNISIEDIDQTTSSKYREGVLHSLEGFLFPETYYIPNYYSEVEIAIMMNNELNKVFTQEDFIMMDDLNLNLYDVMTIASLIEKESANDEEKKKVAGVIYNRLNKNMPLQIDATVIYAITKGHSHIGRLLYKDLEYDSLYNTYLYKGLPPGPIASPGYESIKAAINPEEHDYLYYVLDGNGHVFSETYKEHLRNKNN